MSQTVVKYILIGILLGILSVTLPLMTKSDHIRGDVITISKVIPRSATEYEYHFKVKMGWATSYVVDRPFRFNVGDTLYKSNLK